MEKIKFGDSEVYYPIESIQPVAVHVMRIIFADDMPDESAYAEPMTLYSQGDIEESTLTGWNTIYYYDGESKTIYLSDDEKVYTPPTTPEPGDTDPGDTEPYEPTLEEVQSYKISQMESACTSTIQAGIEVTFADGTTEHFSLTTTDQLSLLEKQIEIDHGATEIDYYATNELSKYYSAEDMQLIITTAEDFIDYQLTYCNELVLWIKTLTDKDEIEAIYYGIEIPKEHRSSVLEDMLPTGDDETGMLPQEGNNDDNTDEGGSDDDDGNSDSGNVGAGGEEDIENNEKGVEE